MPLAAAVAVIVWLAAAVSLQPTYRYTESTEAWLYRGSTAYEVLMPRTRQIWIAPNGSGWILQRWGAPIFFGPRDRMAWSEADDPQPVDDTAYVAGQLDYVDLASVPSDPSGLVNYLRAKASSQPDGGGPFGVLKAARSLLLETVPPAGLARAILRALEATQGLVVHPGVDRVGRTGTAVSADSDERPRVRWTLILDSATGALLEDTETLLDANPVVDASPPVIIGEAEYLRALMTTAGPQGTLGP
jgi:hypothetical protein